MLSPHVIRQCRLKCTQITTYLWKHVSDMKVHPENKTAHKRKKSEKTEDVGAVSLFAASLRHQTTDFFNNSTLHGVRYIAEKERPFCEKLVSLHFSFKPYQWSLKCCWI